MPGFTPPGGSSQDVIACPACDLLQVLPALPLHGKASCTRCGETLATRHADPLDLPLALTVAAIVTFAVANTTPLMGLSVAGREASTTILGGALEMWQQGRELTAAVVAFCAVIAPAAHLLFLLVVLLAIRRPPAPQWVGEMLRGARLMRPWSMTEVMMLGILVALVKIAQLATVEPGIGTYAVGVFILLLSTILVTFDPREVWTRVEWADGTISPTVPEMDSSGALP
jgi:paraquat-inducible protein A